MKPKVKPANGWRFRIILCDDKGNVVLDDFHWEGYALEATERLMARLLELRKHGEG